MEINNTIFKTLNFYDKCETIPLYNWIKYFETQDLRYFNNKRKENKKNHDTMIMCFNDYITLTESIQIVSRFVKMHKIMKLTTKYNSVMMLCRSLKEYPKELQIQGFKSLAKELEKWDYRIDPKKEVFEQITKIENRVKGIKTKIELLKIELQKEDNKESVSIEKQLLIVGRDLKINYKLNAKELTLKEWIELQKQHKQEYGKHN